jgi:hypothetical protein
MVFMHNNSSDTGLYNDVDNHWIIYNSRNAQTQLYYDNTNRFQTTSTGAQVNGNLTVTGTISSSSSGGGGVAYFANIDGTGTVNLRTSDGISSVTDLAVGVYRPNLSPTLSSSDHAPVSGGNSSVGNFWQCWGSTIAFTSTTDFRIYCAAQGTTGSSLGDWDIVTVIGNE